LTFDYNHKLDIQVLTGPGASGQLSGILNVAGINAVTYMDATPTLQELWARRVFMPPDAVAMTAYHWYWSASRLRFPDRQNVVYAAALLAVVSPRWWKRAWVLMRRVS
jgi:hypothetical protein